MRPVGLSNVLNYAAAGLTTVLNYAVAGLTNVLNYAAGRAYKCSDLFGRQGTQMF